MAEPARSANPVADLPGDEAFGRLLVDMQPRIRSFLRKLERAAAEDLVQETLARAWRSRTSFDARRGAPEAWLLRIAFTAYLDQRRPGTQALGPAFEPACPAPGPAERASSRDRAAVLLQGLPRRERQVLLMFHRDGCSIAAIAGALGLPEGTVKSHLHRARARLWERERTGDRR